ncbi:SDR family NAD(P)-dependent oxidoreductase [Sciscionella marina]|uniref:SDR family NAD(P)-dependent oxidoreductase n=1 Tax=Sciscionella marina TaxID=508770 RepID=UPI000382097A|nr:SDR family oxidoreductase [Sciscionella marina]
MVSNPSESPVHDSDQPLAPEDVWHGELFRLDDRRYAVLGAGSGIGEHVSRTLVAMGAKVLCVDVDERRAAAIGESVGMPSVVADVTRRDGIVRVRDRVESSFGNLDGYVDVIGRMRRKRFDAFTLSDWEEEFRINLRHAFLSARELAPIVARTDNGAIVYVSSSMGAHAGRTAPGYGPAKAALENWVKQLAAEYGPMGTRVNAVAPGLFLSPRVVSNAQAQQRLPRFAAKTFLGRLGQPHEIAATIGFLLTPAAGYITGVSIPVEGGARLTDSTGLDEFAD